MIGFDLSNDDVNVGGGFVSKYISPGARKVMIKDFAIHKAQTGKIIISALCEEVEKIETDVEYTGLSGSHKASSRYGKVDFNIYIDVYDSVNFDLFANDIKSILVATGKRTDAAKIVINETDAILYLEKFLPQVAKLISNIPVVTMFTGIKKGKFTNLKFKRFGKTMPIFCVSQDAIIETTEDNIYSGKVLQAVHFIGSTGTKSTVSFTSDDQYNYKVEAADGEEGKFPEKEDKFTDIGIEKTPIQQFEESKPITSVDDLPF